MQTHAILFTGVNQVEHTHIDIPAPGPGEVLVEAAYTCVSPGTELRCLAGQQAGAAAWPFIPGYALAGRVVECGPGVALAPGAAVYCHGTQRASVNRTWGGHVNHAVVAATDLYPIPAGVDLLQASAAHLAAIAYHGVRLSRAQPHETVAVLGLGPIGSLSARLHALTGARVIAADLSAARVAAARAAGIEAFLPTGDLAAGFWELFAAGADVVVDATGHPAALAQAIAVARNKPWGDSDRPGARLLVQGSYAGDFAVPYQDAFVKELTILLPRDTQPQDVHTVLDFHAARSTGCR